MAAGHIQVDALVPEGFEDISLEGVQPWNIQVKSRGALSGEFEVYEASDHILKVWEQHTSRSEPGARLAVIFERAIKGEQISSDIDGPNTSLGKSLPQDSNLLQSLRTKAKKSGMPGSEVEELLASSTFAVTSWEEVTNETLSCLEELEGLTALPPSSLMHFALLLRVAIGDASNENASRAYGDRRSLSRTEVVGDIERFVTQIDLDSLEAAIREGICEPLQLGDAEIPDSSRFYEGVATQPFHVASGLVVHRPDVTKQIKSGLEQKSAVVISGPSGVGKSAVLWTIPEEMPHVLWFRVRRLAPEDVSSIIRLARAYSASVQNPVGFLVDSAGTGDFAGWDRLRSEAGAIQGIHLVATARNEDLALLGDMAECSTVEIRLDEHTAEMIHRGLVERGATTTPHWREAFEDADGLTLEFTHLLTSGVRLRDLIDDQINQRMVEKRHSEINVLALVSVADRWSAEVSSYDIASACDLSELEMREALDRLRAEHLVVERDGWIGGLHRLRSTAICNAIHDRPPPALDETIRTVLPHIPTRQLHRFIASMLKDNPDAREIIISSESTGSLSLDRIAACMQGIRLADFFDLAENWNRIAEQHDFPVTARPTLFTFAVGKLEPFDLFPGEFHTAWETIVNDPGRDSRSDFISAVGLDRLVELLVSATSTAGAHLLLAVLDGSDPEFTISVRGALLSELPLTLAMKEASLESLAELLATAYDVDPGLAQALVEAIGGERTIIERIRANSPWLTQLEIQERNGHSVGFARLLHVSEAHQPSPEDEVIAIGKTLLQCLPQIESIDVQALLPGDQEFRLHGINPSAKQFKRDQINSSSSTAWNQARLNIALGMLSKSDSTRLQEALPLLGDAADLTSRICSAFVLGNQPHPSVLAREIAELHKYGLSLPLPQQPTKTSDFTISDTTEVKMTDNLSEFITGLGPLIFERLRQPAQYRALSAYLVDTVINKQIARIAGEPWHLIGIEGCPASLEQLRTCLLELATIVGELSYGQVTLASLREDVFSRTQHRPLERIATACQKAKRQRRRTRIKEIKNVCRSSEFAADLFDSVDQGFSHEYRISIEVDSLFDWFEAFGQLTASISQEQQSGETFIFIPLRDNRPVPMFAMRFISNLWPEPQPDGLERLSEPHTDQIASTFNKAQAALQTISGICCLPEEQQDHPKVQVVADNANSELEAAYERLCDGADDPVVDWLRSVILELGVQVQAECDGATTEAGFAAQIALTLTTDEVTEYSTLILYAKCIALEWEIDPVAAAELLLEDDD